MGYSSLESCLLDLEKHGHLVRVKEEIDPHLDMAAIHLKVYEAGGPTLLFEQVKGSKFRAASNIFGSLARSKFIFRDTLEKVKSLIHLKNNPASVLQNPLSHISTGLLGLKSFPKKSKKLTLINNEISIADIPQIKHWPNDGGAFVTLPQVYTENILQPGIKHANLGMYRIQLSGNDYKPNAEIGLHYQLHRGIGVHQTIANNNNKPLKVSCFVGGPPAHTLSAVMPLPEGMSEMLFAGVLGNRRFRYSYENEYMISSDADFVITGYVNKNENKIEGPFGDHLGYYSLQHQFPLMHVHKVYAKPNAIWPFTVVGRPPQEDTSFGELIHAITGDAIPNEIPGVLEVHAVDAAGVHPLLLAIGSERYTPYAQTKQPAELLTIANHILGTGQLSLAKYLFITADDTKQLTTHNIEKYLEYVLERIHFSRDLHFYTKTSIDTLDYSGETLNQGSKVVFAAYGEPCRQLCQEVPNVIKEIPYKSSLVMRGVVAIALNKYVNAELAKQDIDYLNKKLYNYNINEVAIIVLCDDAPFLAEKINNFLWVTFTRSNPANDIDGIDSFIENKHWGCRGPLIIDARVKPHHAPELEILPETEKRIEKLFNKGGSLYGVLK